MQNLKLIKEDFKKIVENINFDGTSFEDSGAVDGKSFLNSGRVFTSTVKEVLDPSIEIRSTSAPVIVQSSGGINQVNANFRVRCLYDLADGDYDEIENLLDELVLIFNQEFLDYIDGSSNWFNLEFPPTQEVQQSEDGAAFKDFNVVAQFETSRRTGANSKSVADL